MNSILRLTLLSLTLGAGLAFAQPANDACSGALPIAPPVAPPAGYPFSRSPITAMFGAATTTDLAFSCQATTNASVWYSFTPAQSGRYQLQTCDEHAPGTTFTNTVLAVYEGTCGALTELAQGCDDNYCGSQSRVVVTLTQGTTYLIQVAKTSAPVAADTVQVTINMPSGAETCSGTIPTLPLNSSVPVSIVSTGTDDSQVGGGAACYSGVGHSTTATVQALPGRDVVHRFTVPRNGAYSFRLGNSQRSTDSALYLTDSCTAAMTPPQLYSPPQCIAAANRQGSSTVTQEAISCVALTAGQDVFVWVDEGTTQSTLGASFGLEVSECIRENEPNNTTANAGPLSCPLTGSVNPAGDVDYYDLGLAPAGARLFSMVEAGASGVNLSTSFDLQLRVTTATDTVEFDNNDLADPFGSTAPGVAGTPLAAGVRHFLRVTHASATSIAEPYLVYSAIQTGTATPEVEPNDSVAQAGSGALNYFSGTVPSTADADFFAFEAIAGEVVYLALDSHPARGGSTNTGNHTLELWGFDGARVAVNDGTLTVNSNTVPGVHDAGTPTSPSEHIVYRIPRSGQYYARVGRTGTTAGTNNDYLLSIVRNCATGGGLVAPSLTSLTPTTGSVQGSELITLTGTGFGPGSSVTFGSNAAEVTQSNFTTLVVRSPLGLVGPVDVRVSNAAGSSTLTGGFTYFEPIIPPTVTSVVPPEGPSAGGATVTINGSLFKTGAEVSFEVGGVVVPATNVIIVNTNRLTAVTPAHAEGNATVIVRNPVDDLSGSLSNGYRFNDVPTVTAVTPPSGLTAGGYTVTLTGTSFRPGATVRFGTAPSASVTVSSATSLTASVPASANNGPVDVTVTNPDGQQVVRVDGFTYVFPAPTLSSVTPGRGPSAGGTVITLTGSNFLAQPTVLVGGLTASAVTRLSATSITATTPAGSGVVDVAVANTDGQGAVAAGAFTYDPAPVIGSITPARGPVQGGTRITLTGQHFLPGASLRIGGSPAMAVTMSSSTTLVGYTPSGPAGTADLELVNGDGQTTTLRNGFTWDAAPAITSVTPETGSVAGGTVVTIVGAGFVSGAEVFFGTQAATNVTVASASSLTATAPARAMGVVSLMVKNPDGQQGEKTAAFRYVAAPALTSISPAMGDVRGGMVTRLTGSGFGAQTTVSFGGVASPLVTLVDDTQIDAVTPAQAMGVVDVTVANPDGAMATLTGGFTFTRAAPTLRAVAPASGPDSGGTAITVTGTGFATGVSVSVGGSSATDIVLVSSELLRAKVPGHAAGAGDVTVTNDDGQSATLAGAFTWVAEPDGQVGVVSDGGTLGGPPDAGTGPTTPTGCGCSSLEGSVLAFAALGLLLRRGRA